MAMKGVKETKELVAGIGVVVKALKISLKDGKINFADAPALLAAVRDPALKEAINGIDQIDEEFKDLSIDEGLELLQAVNDLIKSIKSV